VVASVDAHEDTTPIPNPPLTIHDEGDPASPQASPEFPYQIVDRTLQANRVSESLQAYRKLDDQEKDHWQLVNGLLTGHGKLMVPDKTTLRTQLIEPMHAL
jgi:hypothetical protein